MLSPQDVYKTGALKIGEATRSLIFDRVALVGIMALKPDERIQATSLLESFLCLLRS